MTYTCLYCSRRFPFKGDIDRHNTTCRFFYMQHRLAMEVPPEKDASTKKPPPAPSLAGLMRTVAQLSARMDLMQKDNARLRADVDRLKGERPSARENRSPRAPRLLADGEAPRAPDADFEDWARAISVDVRHLECVGKKGVLDAIRMCVGEHLESGAAPVRVREKRAVSLYAHHAVGGWTLMGVSDLNHVITCATRGLAERFTDWQRDNKDALESCARTQEKEIAYMSNLINTRISRDQRRADLRQFLLTAVSLDREDIECA